VIQDKSVRVRRSVALSKQSAHLAISGLGIATRLLGHVSAVCGAVFHVHHLQNRGPLRRVGIGADRSASPDGPLLEVDFYLTYTSKVTGPSQQKA